MLRLYSQIDNRVRQLAYLVKAWAKARDINTPQQGTLGSYAYVITVLHFLQVINRSIFFTPEKLFYLFLEST